MKQFPWGSVVGNTLVVALCLGVVFAPSFPSGEATPTAIVEPGLHVLKVYNPLTKSDTKRTTREQMGMIDSYKMRAWYDANCPGKWRVEPNTAKFTDKEKVWAAAMEKALADSTKANKDNWELAWSGKKFSSFEMPSSEAAELKVLEKLK